MAPAATEAPARREPQTELAAPPPGVRGLRVFPSAAITMRKLGQPSFASVRIDPKERYTAAGGPAWQAAFHAGGFTEAKEREDRDLEVRFTWDQATETDWMVTVELRDVDDDVVETARVPVRYRPTFEPAPGRDRIAPDDRWYYDVSYDAAVRALNQIFASDRLAAYARERRPPVRDVAEKVVAVTKALGSALEKPPKPTHVIAVFDVQDAAKSFDGPTTDQLTEYLVARVSEVGYRVVPRDQLRTQLVEAKVEGYKECFEQSCQIELGKAAAAEKSLATKILRIGDACAMTSTLYDLKSETTERAASARTDCSASALLGGVDRIVEQLAK
jgi:hypothetical protein